MHFCGFCLVRRGSVLGVSLPCRRAEVFRGGLTPNIWRGYENIKKKTCIETLPLSRPSYAYNWVHIGHAQGCHLVSSLQRDAFAALTLPSAATGVSTTRCYRSGDVPSINIVHVTTQMRLFLNYHTSKQSAAWIA